jgi:hypothetical protein
VQRVAIPSPGDLGIVTPVVIPSPDELNVNP